MRRILDLSHPIASGIPAWVEMAGTFGLAKTLVSTWEDYEETAYLRTHGKVKELYRTTLVVMSDNGATHVDGTRHFDPSESGRPRSRSSRFTRTPCSSTSAISGRCATTLRRAR